LPIERRHLHFVFDGVRAFPFFAPFSSARYFLPFHPIEVSPISIGAFFTHRGLEVLESEVLWIWLPFLGLAVALLHFPPTRRATR